MTPTPTTDARADAELADRIDAAHFIRLVGMDKDVDGEERDRIVAALRRKSQGTRGDERAAVIEECANIADRAALRCVRERVPGDGTAMFVAQQIRALSPPQQETPSSTGATCARCGSSGDTFVLCAGCQSPLAAPQPSQRLERKGIANTDIDDAILKFARDRQNPLRLTYESGTYEITKPTSDARAFANAILALLAPRGTP